MTSTPPPCRMLFRSKDGVELFTVPPDKQENDRKFLLKGATTLQVMSPNGDCVYFHQAGVGVVKCNLNDNTSTSTPFLEDSTRVQLLHVSPKGTFLVTWEKLVDGDTPNLKVWNASTGALEHGFVQKNVRRDAWPYLKWTHNEEYAFLQVTNEVRVYPGNCFSQDEPRYIDRIKSEGITTMSVPSKASSGSPYLLTTFCPTNKDKPGRVALLQYPAKSNPTKNNSAYPTLVSKSLYQVEEVAVHWSPKGDAALVAMQTSVDTTGESYYGSATLYLFTCLDSTPTSVPLPNNSTGPVLDVAWMPNPDKPPCFCVISGKMPSMASLHHGTSAEPLFLFGHAHRNTVAWSSHGRFLCCAGFGNLQGGMTFWDRNKLKVIPQYVMEQGKATAIENPQPVANCTVGYGWSPDSRMFYSSTVSPRMNVDNGVRLYKYNGQELSNQLPWKNEWYTPDKLLEATFVPASDASIYPDRPQTPPPRGVDEASTSAAPTTTAAPVAAKKPAGRYVPPSARGRTSGGTSLAERMRREKEGSMMGATKVTKPTFVSTGSSTQKVIPGMAPVQKSKNALKKERQRAAKAKKAQEEAEAKAQEEAQTKAAAAAAAAAADPEKRARKIKKTLKQIEELKARDAASLNEDQTKKVGMETELRDELATLGL